MDVVSDAIAAVRIGRPSSNRLRVHGTWRARIPEYDGAGFHVVLAGSCWLLPDGGAPLVLGPGDAVLLPHGTGHVLADAPLDAGAAANATPIDRLLTPGRPPAPARSLVRPNTAADTDTDAAGAAELLCGKYRLDHSRTHPLMTELPDVVHLPNRLGRHPELRAAVDLLGGELAADRPGGALAVPGLIDLLLVYMVRAWLTREPAATARPATAQAAAAQANTQPAGARWPAALHDPVVAAALRAVHEDPAHPWTTDRLAERAGVSRATLTRRFTALVGSPPMAYLTWWRLTRAATLLRDTAHPLEAIARRVGYSTPYALSHAFTRLFGTTPGRYRTDTAH
ncbi:cupin domain-containing protein [Kitasatospora sp. NPDC058170]|uniref:AraC family transcriptional regulator n=1 Tax=Kitasatospora sp. NPDC058170 TaxID=3346364 RepID=UPI0036DAA779